MLFQKSMPTEKEPEGWLTKLRESLNAPGADAVEAMVLKAH